MECSAWSCGRGLVLGSISIGAGLILSLLAYRALASSLWTLGGRMDYALLPAVAIPLLLVTRLLAAYIPARRASLIDPMYALRDEYGLEHGRNIERRAGGSPGISRGAAAR